MKTGQVDEVGVLSEGMLDTIVADGLDSGRDDGNTTRSNQLSELVSVSKETIGHH
jgi:hypothetical protein